MGGVYPKQIIITTLNYSGILYSPFEFYSEEHAAQQKMLSQRFEQNLKQMVGKDYSRQTFKWSLGKIDQKMQKQRYTPIYNQNVGIQQGKIITQQNIFQKIWQNKFNHQRKNIAGNEQFQENQINNCKKFDWLCYKTILQHVYNTKNLNEIKQGIVEPYQKFMYIFFKKPFLNQQAKWLKTQNAIDFKQVDIVFIQEANQYLLNKLKNKNKNQFQLINSQKGESLIYIRKKKFKKIHNSAEILSSLDKEFVQKLNWNNDTAIGFVDNLILISAHLSSKKEKNKQQINLMQQTLDRLRKIYFSCHIIVGMDANSFIPKAPPKFYIFPDNQKDITTKKKRTMLQPQVNKGQTLAETCRDHIISNLKFKDERVVSILDKKSKQIQYLPCEEHPFDHFTVTARVKYLFSEQ